jgi:hypothetical protein
MHREVRRGQEGQRPRLRLLESGHGRAKGATLKESAIVKVLNERAPYL